MNQDENRKAEELKYEGLTALILDKFEDQSNKITDLKGYVKERLDEVKEQDLRRNGHIADALERIGKVEKIVDERGLTCQPVVTELKDELGKIKFLGWIQRNWKWLLGTAFGIILILMFFFAVLVDVLSIEQLLNLK